jgi:hypothetical protein
LTASELAVPGEAALQERIRKLNQKCGTAVENIAKQSLANKKAFDGKLPPVLQTFCVGDVLQLQNEAHIKGAPHWFGPFEIKKVLPDNVYILLDHDGADYLWPVNGNSLRLVALQSLILNDMWSPPPIIALKA